MPAVGGGFRPVRGLGRPCPQGLQRLQERILFHPGLVPAPPQPELGPVGARNPYTSLRPFAVL